LTNRKEFPSQSMKANSESKTCDGQQYLVMFAEAGTFNARVHSGLIGQRIVNDKIVTNQCHTNSIPIHNFTVNHNFCLIRAQFIFVPPIHPFWHA